MITYIKGDLLKSDCNVIVHGCNCQGSMGSGIAKSIREQFPDAYEQYKQLCDNTTRKRTLLGTIQAIHIEDEQYIINAFTQEAYGVAPDRYVSYDAVDECMSRIGRWYTKHNSYKIGLPKIGAGLGGGSWPVIEAIVKEHLDGFHVEVYEL